jgi:SAM-dependent methyltransferase
MNKGTGQPISSDRAQEFFEDLWARGDAWSLEESTFEHRKYDRQLALLEGRRYERALEIGCGSGQFTRRLAQIVTSVTGIDVAPSAIIRAKTACAELPNTDFRVENVVEHDFRVDQPWDLLVMSETVYYLGWLYSFFDVVWLARELYTATKSGGIFLMTNTYGDFGDNLLLPWIIRSYRDCFLNVGYTIQAEEVFHGEKNRQELDALITVFKA